MKLKVGDIVELDVCDKVCCNECGNIIGRTIDCLLCDEEDVLVHSAPDYNDNNREAIICSSCDTVYLILDNSKAKVLDIW